MKTLTPLSDYVIEQSSNDNIEKATGLAKNILLHIWSKIFKRAQFIKRKLLIGMFVPADEEGNVLEEPLTGYAGNEQYEGCEWDEYQQAKDKVIFKIKGYNNFEDAVQLTLSDGQILWYAKNTKKFFFSNIEDINTIEDLAKFNLELTNSKEIDKI